MAVTTIVPLATQQKTSYTNNGFTTDTVGGLQFPLQQGVPYQNLYVFKVVPAALSNTCVTSSQSWPGATTSYRLNTISSLTGNQTITSAITYNGKSAIKLDCERLLSVTPFSATTASSVITVEGYDYRGVAVTMTFTLPEGVDETFDFGSAISVITSITASAN